MSKKKGRPTKIFETAAHYSDELAREIAPGETVIFTDVSLKKEKKLSFGSETLACIRGGIPFTMGQMIVPKIKRTRPDAAVRRSKASMGYTKLKTKEDYINYKFEESNFRHISQGLIDRVCEKAKEHGIDTNTVEGKMTVLKLLTIVDTVLVSNDIDKFASYDNMTRIMAYIRDGKDALKIFFKTLSDMGILSYRGELCEEGCLYMIHSQDKAEQEDVVNVDFSQIQQNRDKSPKKVLTPNSYDDKMMSIPEREERLLKTHIAKNLVDSVSGKENIETTNQTDEGLELLLASIRDMYVKAKNQGVREEYEQTLKENESLQAEVEKLRVRMEKLKEENAQLKQDAANHERILKEKDSAINALTIANKETRKILSENAELKKNLSVYAENIKDYKNFKEVVKGRLESTVDRFTEKSQKILMEYEENQNKGRFLRNMNTLLMDTSQSVMTSVKAMNA